MGIVAACLVAAFALDHALADGGGHSPASGAGLAFAKGAGGTRWQQGGGGSLARRLSTSGLSMAAGTVQSVASSSITLQTLRGATVTVSVSVSTIYRERGTSTASLADVSAGARVVVLGKKATGGGLTASRVLILPAGAGGGPSG